MSAKGFTLIELLVVIAIIGVLATVVLASLNTARRKSRDARRVSDIKQLQLALELYFDGAGAGQYPVGSTTCDGTTNDVTDQYGLQQLVSSGYIASIPIDPNAPAPACYRYISQAPAGARTFYHLAGVLEDSANQAMNSDRDCNDATAGSCSTGSTGWVGQTSNGSSSDCAAGAVPDRCYDVSP